MEINQNPKKRSDLATINKISKLICSDQERLIEKVFNENTEIQDSLKYCLKDSGILFRPWICYLGIELSKKALPDYLFLLSAIEFIQKSTLVLDDIIDNSPLRNNLKSAHVRYGTSVAVVNGEILKSLGIRNIYESNSIGDSIKFKIIKELENAYINVYHGQNLDIIYESYSTISEEQYFKMIYLTTASLIESSLVCGLIISNLPISDIHKLRIFGQKIGLGYQVRDDIVNLISDSSNGKILAEDLRSRKKRLPVVYLLNNSSRSAIKEFLAIWNQNEIPEHDIITLLEILQNEGAIDYSVKKLQLILEETYDHLQDISIKHDLSFFTTLVEKIGDL